MKRHFLPQPPKVLCWSRVSTECLEAGTLKVRVASRQAILASVNAIYLFERMLDHERDGKIGVVTSYLKPRSRRVTRASSAVTWHFGMTYFVPASIVAAEHKVSITTIAITTRSNTSGIHINVKLAVTSARSPSGNSIRQHYYCRYRRLHQPAHRGRRVLELQYHHFARFFKRRA